jgi:HSP20 family protein
VPLPVRRTERPRQMTERWDPFRELDDLHGRMEQLMQSIWGGTRGRERPDEEAPLWVPDVDIEETDDAWIVEAEVPGVNREDVNVEVRDSELMITGEIKERERAGVLRRRTRRVGRFEYRVTLPGDADPDRIEATLDDGILTLRVPKPEQARPRRIEVRPGSGAEAGAGEIAGPAGTGAGAGTGAAAGT